MNKVLASFTRSEKSIITFVLVLVASGLGLQQWQNRSQSAMVFSDGAAKHLVGKSLTTKAITTSGRIDVNSADSKTLEVLPGVGPAMAATLVRHREANGAYKSMADLDRVPGIGPAMMSKLAPMVEFGGGSGLPAAPVGTPASVMAQPLKAVPSQGVIPAGAVMQFASLPAPATRSTVNNGSAATGSVVNINTAGATELATLNGIGPALAQRIIDDRTRSGPYRTPESIIRVKGIGPKLLGKNRGRIIVQ